MRFLGHIAIKTDAIKDFKVFLYDFYKTSAHFS